MGRSQAAEWREGRLATWTFGGLLPQVVLIRITLKMSNCKHNDMTLLEFSSGVLTLLEFLRREAGAEWRPAARCGIDRTSGQNMSNYKNNGASLFRSYLKVKSSPAHRQAGDSGWKWQILAVDRGGELRLRAVDKTPKR